ncbi:MAG: toprim domain-containing protein, partial [Xanthomarina sp.]
CYLVEGYTDVIQFHQRGIKNVVSSSGTALTPDQIRLINRLTKNITLLFDGDEAGIRASLRGVDLILEQGMNVKICAFPKGDDPDSFAKKNTLEELTLYLEEHAQDFIQFKASMLFEASKNDPIKKAETVRDIVNSISKIPDRIKREIYIQECSKIMDISEEVLYSTLAQSSKKDFQEANKQFNQEKKAFDVIKNTEPGKSVDVQYELERKIIQILLLYGNRTEDFEDLILKENDKNELILEPIVQQAKVFEKIFLDLQEDEMEFTNLKFKDLYYKIIDTLNQNPDFALESFVKDDNADLVAEMTTILMEDERYALSDWERQNIFPKKKTDSIAQLVNETILNLRCFLISKKIDALSQSTKNNLEVQYREVLEEVMGYKKLDNLLSRKLNKAL